MDDLTRFVDPTTVVTVVEDDPADQNYEPLQNNLERLNRMTDQDGRPLRVVTLPMPRPLYHDGQRLPASYANFYIANGVVLLPTYDPDRDEQARATLQSLFPGREVIGIDCTDLVWGLGAFHCVTQQWPSVRESVSGKSKSVSGKREHVVVRLANSRLPRSRLLLPAYALSTASHASATSPPAPPGGRRNCPLPARRCGADPRSG